MLNKIIRYIRINIFTIFLRHPLSSVKKNEPSPLFILSAGRSGSTLLRKILIQTKKISIPPETDSFIPSIANIYIKRNFQPWDYLIDELFHLIQNEKQLLDWDITFDEQDKKIIKYELQDRSLHGIIYYIYKKHSNKYYPGTDLWGDKTPLLIYHTPILRKIFPQAKFLFLMRDGRDVVNSFVKNCIYNDLLYLCHRWIYSVRISNWFLRRRNRLTCLIRYENLVLQPNVEIEKVCSFLNIPYSGSYLAPRPVDLGDNHYSHHKNINKEISTEYIGGWKNDLSEMQKKKVTNILKSTLISAGYIKK